MNNDDSFKGCVSNCAAYDRAGLRRDITLDQISDVLAADDGSFVWVGLYGTGDALLNKLQEEFDLHDLAIEDAQHAHQRPKIEAYGNSLFAVIHTAQATENKIVFGETYAFLGERYLITVRHGTSLSYAPVRTRVESEPKLLALGPSYCFYAILDFVVDQYLPISAEFGEELRKLEDLIFAETYRRETILKLYELKRELTHLRLAVAPLQDILAQLVRGIGDRVPKEVRPYFRDVLDHVKLVNEATDTTREMLTSAMNVNLSLVASAQGEVVKKLAGWAALLAAPTLLASWYGMNFHNIPELRGQYNYYIATAVAAITCIALYRYLKKIQWL